MSQNQDLLSELEKLLNWKKSKKFYAERLQITEEEQRMTEQMIMA